MTDEDLRAVRQKALDLAEVVTTVYSAFKAEVEDFDPGEIRASGHAGMLKLVGLHVDEDDIDGILNGEQPEEDLSEGDADDSLSEEEDHE
jgi:hypothetical protein